MPSNQSKTPFRVLGIALVVDQRGKGPRMVLRYPAAATASTSPSNGLHVLNDMSKSGPAVSNPQNSYSKLLESEDDLFFRLPPRQIAKLFRPKPSLCGQPVTLSVGGTVFCCCAVLMDDDEINGIQQQSSTQLGESLKNDDLVLFSVIVALSTTVKLESMPISNWTEEADSSTDLDEKNSLQALNLIEGDLSHPNMKSLNRKPSASFLSIRRVHISLSRLCRILEREERRCRYVSLQANYFDRIRENLQKKWREALSERGGESSANATNLPNSGSTQIPNLGANPSSVTTSKISQGGQDRNVSTTVTGGTHRKSNSITVSFGVNDRAEGSKLSGGPQKLVATDEIEARRKLQELEQEILETIMAASPSSNDDEGGFEHQGNLAREFVQVFHALTRNDYDFPPTPSILLSGRDNVVYINRHVAVAIESVSDSNKIDSSWFDSGKPVVRPYHTLLFPSVTPIQLLVSISASRCDAAPHRVQQLLRLINPRSTLSDIALAASLPLKSTLEIASYLVGQGLCFVFPRLSRKMSLACICIQHIREVQLSFSQRFGASINLFVLVSFLSNSDCTLGESMKLLDTSTESHIVSLRERLKASLPSLRHITELNESSLAAKDNAQSDRDMQISVSEKRDELLFEIVVWLCSHKVLSPLQDYIVANVAALNESLARKNDDKKVESTSFEAQRCGITTNTRGDIVADLEFLSELAELECLTGKVSMQACSWRTGVESTKLLSFINRCPHLRMVRRMPTRGDDWGVF